MASIAKRRTSGSSSLLPKEIHEHASSPKVLVSGDPNNAALSQGPECLLRRIPPHDQPQPQAGPVSVQVDIEKRIPLPLDDDVQRYAPKGQPRPADLPVPEMPRYQDDPPPKGYGLLELLQSIYLRSGQDLLFRKPREEEGGQSLPAKVLVGGMEKVPPPALILVGKGDA